MSEVQTEFWPTRLDTGTLMKFKLGQAIDDGIITYRLTHYNYHGVKTKRPHNQANPNHNELEFDDAEPAGHAADACATPKLAPIVSLYISI